MPTSQTTWIHHHQLLAPFPKDWWLPFYTIKSLDPATIFQTKHGITQNSTNNTLKDESKTTENISTIESSTVNNLMRIKVDQSQRDIPRNGGSLVSFFQRETSWTFASISFTLALSSSSSSSSSSIIPLHLQTARASANLWISRENLHNKNLMDDRCTKKHVTTLRCCKTTALVVHRAYSIHACYIQQEWSSQELEENWSSKMWEGE